MTVVLPAITITDAAITHFSQLIAKEGVPEMGLRLFLDHPGRPNAEVGITFCPPGEQKRTDLPFTRAELTIFIDVASAPFLEDARIDYLMDALGGELSIHAPHLKGQKPASTDSLEQRIQYVLDQEVNPALAHHGGMVTLMEITPAKIVVLRFGGGCHGCGMVDVTLKEGIEKTLLAQFPELTGIQDATDHATGENPYYMAATAPDAPEESL